MATRVTRSCAYHVTLKAATSRAPDAFGSISPKNLFSNVTLKLPKGHSLVLLGPNGCGKTSVARALAGLVSLSSGQRTVRPGVRFAYMPQDYRHAFFPWLSIHENLALRLGRSDRQPAGASYADTPMADELDELYRRLELRVDSKRYPDQVSGGQLQLLLFVATIMMPGDVRILDEPFSALDFRRRALASEAISERIANRPDETWIVITHDISEGVQLADRIAVFNTARSISTQIKIELPWPRRFDIRESSVGLAAARVVREAVGIA